MKAITSAWLVCWFMNSCLEITNYQTWIGIKFDLGLELVNTESKSHKTNCTTIFLQYHNTIIINKSHKLPSIYDHYGFMQIWQKPSTTQQVANLLIVFHIKSPFLLHFFSTWRPFLKKKSSSSLFHHIQMCPGQFPPQSVEKTWPVNRHHYGHYGRHQSTTLRSSRSRPSWLRGQN